MLLKYQLLLFFPGGWEKLLYGILDWKFHWEGLVKGGKGRGTWVINRIITG